MATATAQARYRAHDTKATIQVRLSPQAVAELDRLVSVRGASGRAEVLETLLAAPSARDVADIAAHHLKQAGTTEIHGTDSTRAVIEVRRHPPRPTWCK